MNPVTHPLSSAGISIFLLEISKFCYIKKHWYRLHLNTQFLILLMFIESLKVVLIKMVLILMMSAKMDTQGPLKIKVFWNNVYEVINSVHDITNKILLRASNYIVDEIMGLKFGNSSTSTRKVIITSILQGFDQKNHFFWGVFLVQVQ